MSSYLQSHPWITFILDVRRLSYQDWMLLGEAESKCEHIANVPLLPHVAALLHRVTLARGVLATTAIEGNTLTEEQVLARLAGELRVAPSKEYLVQEIDNVLEACNEIADRMLAETPAPLSTAEIRRYNELVLRNLTLGEDVIPGEIRRHAVRVGSYLGAPPAECAALLERLVAWLNEPFWGENPAHRVAFGILKAIVAHVYLAWIHPFGDGNGRTARLVELRILLESGVPSPAAHLLSNFYNETRSEYYRQLDQASRSGGDLGPFIRYAMQGLVDGLRDQLLYIQAQQLQVHWVNHVHALFPNDERMTEVRQRRLALDLGTQPVPLSEVRYRSARLAEAYAGKTEKTVQRDIAALEALGLVERSAAGVRARAEALLALRPSVRR